MLFRILLALLFFSTNGFSEVVTSERTFSGTQIINGSLLVNRSVTTPENGGTILENSHLIVSNSSDLRFGLFGQAGGTYGISWCDHGSVLSGGGTCEGINSIKYDDANSNFEWRIGNVELMTLSSAGQLQTDGTLRPDNGSVSDPALHSDIDFDTGIYFPSASQMEVSIGGVQTHIFTGSSFQTRSSGTATLFLTSTDSTATDSQINMGPLSDNDQGQIKYDDSTDEMLFQTGNALRMTIASDGYVEAPNGIRAPYFKATGGNHWIQFATASGATTCNVACDALPICGCAAAVVRVTGGAATCTLGSGNRRCLCMCSFD